MLSAGKAEMSSKPKLKIIYEDRSILVCIKPAGIPVQTPNPGAADMVSLLKKHRAENGEDLYIGMVHRLDQPVEGVIAFAKKKEAAAALSRQVAERRMEKYYLAAAVGKFGQEEGTLEDWLARDGRENLSHVASPDEKDAKRARLSYRVREYDAGKNVSLVEVKLETGRHHQIRVQLAAAGHPLQGDRKYNPQPGGGNVALCACRLSLDHPSTGRRMTFSAAPENPYFKDFAAVKNLATASEIVYD